MTGSWKSELLCTTTARNGSPARLVAGWPSNRGSVLGRNFYRAFTPVLGPTQPAVQKVLRAPPPPGRGESVMRPGSETYKKSTPSSARVKE
jgi:hypothetical protein